MSGHHTWENDDYGGYLNVFTLDDSLNVTETQTLSFPGLGDDNVSFGTALATSEMTVAVGVPHAKVDGHDGAGAVHLYTPDARNRLVRRVVLTQDSEGMPGEAETWDRFGATLAMRDGRLAIGAPGESDEKILSSGTVQPVLWDEAALTYTAYRAIDQDTGGVPGRNEKNDHFGTTLAIARGLTATDSYDVLIGATKTHGKREAAGSVTVANFDGSICRGYSQATRGIPGSTRNGNQFFIVGVLQTSAVVDTVLIGAPGVKGTAGDGYAIRSDGRRLGSTTSWSTIAIPPDAPGEVQEWGNSFGG